MRHTDLSSRNCSYEILGRKPTARTLKACTYLSARTGCLPKRSLSVDKEDRQERVPDVIAQLNSYSCWVCCYQVAQTLEWHKVQRIASRRTALSSRCLSRHGCILCHQLHHKMLNWFSTCWCCSTPGLPLKSKYVPVRQ